MEDTPAEPSRRGGILNHLSDPYLLIVDTTCASFLLNRLDWRNLDRALSPAGIFSDLAVGCVLYAVATSRLQNTSRIVQHAQPVKPSKAFDWAYRTPPPTIVETLYWHDNRSSFRRWLECVPRVTSRLISQAQRASILRLVFDVFLGLAASGIAAFCALYAIASQAGLAANGARPNMLDLMRNIESIVYAAGSVDDTFRAAFALNASVLVMLVCGLACLRTLASKHLGRSTRKLRALCIAALACFVLSALTQSRATSKTAVLPNILLDCLWTLSKRPWRHAMAPPIVSAMLGSTSSQAAPNFFIPSIHGMSNIDGLPRWSTAIERRQYRHVFLIWLESADAKAWPWQKSYCQEHNCADIAPQFDTPDYMTPFFKQFARESLQVPNFMTNAAYSVKSDHSSACGIHPPIADFTSVENDVADQRPCLAHILRNQSYSTAFFSAAEASLDHFHTILEKQGWETIYGLESLLEEYPDIQLVDPRLAEDHDIIEPMSDWLDEQLAQDKPTLLSWHTSTCHFPFYPIQRLGLVDYTWGSAQQNRHLNAINTDSVLQEFWTMLEKKQILNDTLVVLHGDHGPRLNKDGVFIGLDTHHRNLAVPALISTPSTRARANDTALRPLAAPADELWTTADVLPTMLDLMSFPEEMIREYPGQSMLRSINPRLTFAAQIPGATHLQADDGRYKAVRDSWDSLDYCGYDRLLDPAEEWGWCTATGWAEQVDATGNVTTGRHLYSDLEDAEHFVNWVKWAGAQTKRHVEMNQLYWFNSTLNSELNADFRSRWGML